MSPFTEGTDPLMGILIKYTSLTKRLVCDSAGVEGVAGKSVLTFT